MPSGEQLTLRGPGVDGEGLKGLVCLSLSAVFQPQSCLRKQALFPLPKKGKKKKKTLRDKKGRPGSERLLGLRFRSAQPRGASASAHPVADLRQSSPVPLLSAAHQQDNRAGESRPELGRRVRQNGKILSRKHSVECTFFLSLSGVCMYACIFVCLRKGGGCWGE